MQQDPPGTKTLTVTGRGDTLGETFSYPQTIQIICHSFQSPEVKPVNIAFAPSAPALCGTDVTLTAQGETARSTRMRRTPRSAWATQSFARSYALPHGVQLVGGPQTQDVASRRAPGEPQRKGSPTTSEPHTWTLRQTGGGPAGMSVVGEADGVIYFKELPLLSCKRRASGAGSSAPWRAAGWIAVKGRLTGPGSGSIQVVGRNGSRSRAKTVRTDSSHHFHTRLRVCGAAGRWRVTASYAGNGLYRPAVSNGRRVTIPAGDLRC